MLLDISWAKGDRLPMELVCLLLWVLDTKVRDGPTKPPSKSSVTVTDRRDEKDTSVSAFSICLSHVRPSVLSYNGDGI